MSDLVGDAVNAGGDKLQDDKQLQSALNPPARQTLNKILLIPLAVFFVLVFILAIGFRLEDAHLLPSQLIDRPFPEFELAELHDEQRTLTVRDLQGEVSLVNVWATWCPNCVIEHPELTRISNDEGVPLYGINYNDDSAKARAWLQRYGNPYRFNIVDNEGKLGIDLGVYGAPETFVVDASGVIQYKHVGEVSTRVWEETLEPLILHLRGQLEEKAGTD
ncbi:MAG: DsbE family thiol:disulfide interchange protein [bacterium]|nr:DsbE family thiol:disulfide interchange protein [Gammaproteobacteria bacterium]HIL97887.1 DsbE family thiol:disulfide interchange protein [Pseudomonadales bacterium]